MKKAMLTALAAITVAVAAHSQATATNFIANDCAGNPHDFFAELNAGKVIVISWVMPCAGCIAASQTAFGIVQSYAVSNPGQVLMYVVDDFGNTSCHTLDTWVNTNSMSGAVTFSDSTIDMTVYGGVGMPKIIVAGGGYSHTVYFNQNNIPADDSLGIKNAIDSALADITGMSLHPGGLSAALYPNPADGIATLFLNVPASAPVVAGLYNTAGEYVQALYSGTLQRGENSIAVHTNTLAEGVYFIRITAGDAVSVQKLVVVH